MVEKSDTAMIRKLTYEDLTQYLENLENWDALEVVIEGQDEDEEILMKNTRVMIPYVMNDVVECYIVLDAKSVRGVWQPFFEGGVQWAEVFEDQHPNTILFTQEDEGEIVVNFRSAYLETHCYQYHRIGHSWRMEPGEEHLRRLVHLICVLHDKYNYLGLDACNEKEKQLIPLANFRPLRFWTPIDHSIMDHYEDTKEGTKAFQCICQRAFGDQPWSEDENQLWRLLQWYDVQCQEGVKPRKLTEVIAEKILESYALFETLTNMIEEASVLWPERKYNKELTSYIQIQRESMEHRMHKNGFTGRYPEFKRGNSHILIVEEHPFTVMESEEYFFRTFLIDYPQK